MPTRDEIVRALRCTGERACAGCAYDGSPYCVIESGRDAASLIEQQAKEIEKLKDELGPLRVYAKHIVQQPGCNDCAKKRVRV